MKDHIVEEVRKHRIAHTRTFKGDLSAICDDLVRIEVKSGIRSSGTFLKSLQRQPAHMYGHIKSAVPDFRSKEKNMLRTNHNR